MFASKLHTVVEINYFYGAAAYLVPAPRIAPNSFIVSSFLITTGLAYKGVLSLTSLIYPALLCYSSTLYNFYTNYPWPNYWHYYSSYEVDFICICSISSSWSWSSRCFSLMASFCSHILSFPNCIICASFSY